MTKRDTRLRKPKRSAVVEEGLEQEVALVRAFYANRLVVEALENRRRAQVGLKGGLRSSRQGGSVAAILRRWFVGVSRGPLQGKLGQVPGGGVRRDPKI